MVKKKAFLAVSAPIALGLLAAGCGSTSGSSTPSTSSSGPVTITFMEAMSSGTLSTTLKHLVSQFEKTHKGITVNLSAEPSYGVLETKIEASVAGNNAPTIAQAYEDWAAGYAKSDAIVPLGSYVNGKNGLSSSEKAAIWPGIWKDQFIHGTMWMFPFNKSDFVMYYNESMLKKNHLAVPTTWTQFASDAQAATNNASDTWGVSIDPGSSSGASNGTYLYVSLIRAYGGHLLVNNKPNFDSPAAQKALQYLVNLYKAGYLKVGTSYPGQTALGSAHSLFDLSTIASYYYNQQAIKGKFPMGVAALPAGPSGPGNVLQGTNIVMFSSATTAQKNAAWTFMKWLDEPTQAAYWATHTGYLPVTQSALPLMSSYYSSHPYQKIAADSLKYAKEIPPNPAMTQAVGALANGIQAAMVGHQSVSAALHTAQQQALQDFSSQNS